MTHPLFHSVRTLLYYTIDGKGRVFFTTNGAVVGVASNDFGPDLEPANDHNHHSPQVYYPVVGIQGKGVVLEARFASSHANGIGPRGLGMGDAFSMKSLVYSRAVVVAVTGLAQRMEISSRLLEVSSFFFVPYFFTKTAVWG